MAFLKTFVPMLLMVIIILVVYNLLKIYILENIKINKWIVLGIAVAIFIIPNVVLKVSIQGTIWQYVQTGLFLIFFLWFIDLAGLSKQEKARRKDDKNAVIRSKAKPNRVEKDDIEVIKKGKNKKKKK